MGEVRNLPSFEVFSFVFVENCIDPGSGEKYMPSVYGRPDFIMIVASCFAIYRKFVSYPEFIVPFYLVRVFLPFRLICNCLGIQSCSC